MIFKHVIIFFLKRRYQDKITLTKPYHFTCFTSGNYNTDKLYCELIELCVSEDDSSWSTVCTTSSEFG